MIGNPLGLLALLSIPTILGIHFFRRRFQPRSIAGLFLWADPDRDPSSGRRLHRIENRLSLWLELILALIISLYILDLRWESATTLPHLVLVLDSTASMGAVGEETDTAEAARKKIEEIVESKGPDSLVTVISGQAHPVVLCGPAAPLATLGDCLKSWRPKGRGQDLSAALALARSFAGPDTTLHVVSDRVPDEVDEPLLHYHGVGRSMDNAAILYAERRRKTDMDGEEIFAVVASWGSPKTVWLNVSGAGQQLKRQAVDADGTGRPIVVNLAIKKSESFLTLTLNDDALELDNRMVLLAPVDRTVSYFLGNDLSKGLRRDLSHALASMAATKETDIGLANLVFKAGPRPNGMMATGWYVGFGPFDDRGQRNDNDVELGPFLVEGANPILSDVAFSGVVWTVPLGGGKDYRPLVSAGESILIGEGVSPGPRELRFNIDYAASTLGRSTTWPILIYNIVEQCRLELPGCAGLQVASGDSQSVSLTGLSSKQDLKLFNPLGEAQSIAIEKMVSIGPLDELGLYRIELDGIPWASFQVHFRDQDESDLRQAKTVSVGGQGASKVAEEESDVLIDARLHFGLLLVGLMLFVGNALLIKGGRAS